MQQFGDKVTPFLIQKMSLAKNQKVVCSLASRSINIVKLHYVKGVGSFHCFGGKCCEMFGIPMVRYGLPVYVYQTDGGMKKIGNEVEFRMLARGYEGYNNLLTKNEILEAQNSSLTKVDILITCTEDQYQDYTFDVLGPSTWRTLIDKERYQKDMEMFVNHSDLTFGRKLDESLMLKALSTGEAGYPVQDRPSIEDLKNKNSLALEDMKRKPVEGLSVSEEIKKVEVSEEDGDFEDLLSR